MDPQTQQSRRAELYGLLGDLPPRDRPISARTVCVEQRDGYTLERLVLDLNGEEAVPAYFVKPVGAGENLPAVIFSHSHGGYYSLGKDELLHGNSYMPGRPYAEELAARGYAVLCVDHWLFGERHGVAESALFKRWLWRGKCMWGMMVYDSLRAMDYLTSRPEVDSSRIAALGMSMGSTMSWWLSALDERIRVCVDICCLTDFDTLADTPDIDGHGIFYFVPSLLKHFSTTDINALIAPRPHLATAGRYDKLTPLSGLFKVDDALRKAYAEMGAADNWRLDLYDVAHLETPEMRRDILDFLEEHV